MAKEPKNNPIILDFRDIENQYNVGPDAVKPFSKKDKIAAIFAGISLGSGLIFCFGIVIYTIIENHCIKARACSSTTLIEANVDAAMALLKSSSIYFLFFFGTSIANLFGSKYLEQHSASSSGSE